MAELTKKPLRQIARPFVAGGPSGVSIRDRLKGLTAEDEKALRLVGEHMGRLASADLARRCRDGLDHSTDTWAARKRELTAQSSSRWAGSVTSNTQDQWGLSRRAQHQHLMSLEAGIRTIRHRLFLPIGQPEQAGWLPIQARVVPEDAPSGDPGDRLRAGRGGAGGRGGLRGARWPPSAPSAAQPQRHPEDRGAVACGVGSVALVPDC